MGTVFKKTFTKPIPPDAEIVTKSGEQFARHRNSKGKLVSSLLTTGKDGSPRMLVEASTYTAKYRDAGGIVREVKTGCKDETTARQFLARLERQKELIKAGTMTAEQATIGKHSSTPIRQHFELFAEHLAAKGTTRIHREDTLRYLTKIANDCGFSTLGDLKREKLERWLANATREGRSARSRNAYQTALITFANWCIATNRLTSNPFLGIDKANEKADRRRQRRALTEGELLKLLDVAQRRPLEDGKTVKQGRNRGKQIRELKPETIDRLELLGRERALIYKTMVLTGLRKNELATLEIGQLHLETDQPYLELEPANEKNREGSILPIRRDLAEEIGSWLAEKRKRGTSEIIAIKWGSPDCHRLSSSGEKVFNVPRDLRKILDRDLKAAGIPKRDERGRTIDVHALRHTFGTWLSKGGVAPRTAQAAMRHASLEMTMNVYTDPKLLDIAGALDALPALPIYGNQQQAEVKTGTDAGTARIDKHLQPNSLAPLLAPTTDFQGHFLSSTVNMATAEHSDRHFPKVLSVNEKEPLSTCDNGSEMGGTGFEPVNLLNVSQGDGGCNHHRNQGLTSMKNHACTNACTNLAEIAAELRENLSFAERVELARMLLQLG